MANDRRRQLASEYLDKDTAAKVTTGRRRSREAQPQGKPAASSRPLDIAWITDELIAEHRRVWSRMYGRDISESEAIEIIMNIKRLAEIVLESLNQERSAVNAVL